MKILLTGGAGYIGSHTAVELINAGYEVVIADNLSNSKIEILNRIETITGNKPLFYEIDVREKEKLSMVFKENTIDGIVHFAGYKAVGESVSAPIMYYRNNIDTILTVLEVAEKFNTNNIVFSSSATVYGIPPFSPITEDMPINCANPYGWTKHFIEQILFDAQNAQYSINSVILRYFNPIGAHPSGLIGEDPKGIPNNLMPYISQVAVGKLNELRVFGDDYQTKDGTGVRDYIHVVDLARGHVAALKYLVKNKGTEVFNLGTGCGYSVLDVVNTFSEENNINIPYKISPRRPGDIAEYYANPGKAKEILKWEAEKGLDSMCRDSWNWQKNNPEGY